MKVSESNAGPDSASSLRRISNDVRGRLLRRLRDDRLIILSIADHAPRNSSWEKLEVSRRAEVCSIPATSPKPLSQPSDVWIAAAAGSAPSSQNHGFSAGSGSSQGTLAEAPHAARVTADAGETVGIWLEFGWNLAGI